MGYTNQQEEAAKNQEKEEKKLTTSLQPPWILLPALDPRRAKTNLIRADNRFTSGLGLVL